MFLGHATSVRERSADCHSFRNAVSSRTEAQDDEDHHGDPSRNDEDSGAQTVGTGNPQLLAGEATDTPVRHQDEDGQPDGGAHADPVEAMPDAMPCSRSDTPTPAAMNIVVNTRRRQY
jgi:hypothetical protein